MNAATRTSQPDADAPHSVPDAPAARGGRGAARPAPRTQPPHPRGEGADAARVVAAARPWWFAFPGVMLTCANVVLAPLALVVRVAEAAVALALLAAIGAVLAWHLGYVADRDVVAALKPVGQRIMAMAQSAGGS